MGQSISTKRDAKQDLHQFQENAITPPSNNTSSDEISESKRSSQQHRKIRTKSHFLFDIPADTFSVITQFITLYEVVHNMTLIHPYIYESMYHPHDVDTIWNSRSWTGDDIFLFNMEDAYIKGIISFIGKVHVRRARIHLREANEDNLLRVLFTLQEYIEELHITVFESRVTVNIVNKNWEQFEFPNLKTFSSQNKAIRECIVKKSPQLQAYQEFRVHNESDEFSFSTLTCHKDISQLQVLSLKGNRYNYCSAKCAIALAQFLSEPMNLTRLEVNLGNTSSDLFLKIFALKSLQTLSLTETKSARLLISDITNEDLQTCSIPDELSTLTLTGCSDEAFIFFILKKLSSKLRGLAFYRCVIPLNKQITMNLTELSSFISMRSLHRQQVAQLDLQASGKLKIFKFQDVDNVDPSLTIPFESFLKKLPKNLDQLSLSCNNKITTADSFMTAAFVLQDKIDNLRIDNVPANSTKYTTNFILQYDGSSADRLQNHLRQCLDLSVVAQEMTKLTDLRIDHPITVSQYAAVTVYCKSLRRLVIDHVTGETKDLGEEKASILPQIETFVSTSPFSDYQVSAGLLVALTCEKATIFRSNSVKTRKHAKKFDTILRSDVESVINKIHFVTADERMQFTQKYQEAIKSPKKFPFTLSELSNH